MYDSEVRTAANPPPDGKMLDTDETPLLGRETLDPIR